MMTATGVRKEARENLRGKWKKGVLITLCYLVVEMVIQWIMRKTEDSSALNLLMSIGNLVISIPISYGLTVSFMKLKRNEEVEPFDFLTLGFKSFSRSWKVFGNMLLKMIVPVIVTIVTYFGIMFVAGFIVATSTLGAASTLSMLTTTDVIVSVISKFAWIFIIGCVILFAAGIWLYLRQLHYVLSFNIAYDEPELTGKEAVEKSQNMMNGNKGNYFVLTLSFIGWAILSVFSFGIGFLWLLPYMQVAFVCFYETLKNKTDNN